MPIGSSRVHRIGSGTVIAIGLFVALSALLCLGRLVGWSATWRSINVTPLEPHFYDMHVLLDYAACAAKGFDAYIPHSCNPENFNIPPIWLGLGQLEIDGSASTWLSIVIITAACLVVVGLLKGRSITAGALTLLAVLSPSVLMGVERANADLVIFSLVGLAALTYDERRPWPLLSSLALLGLATILKLFPVFCVALGVRATRRSLLFSSALVSLSMIYLAAIFSYILLIRRNVPTTFMLSYGYKVIFLGFDHLRVEARQDPLALADTWVPSAIAIVVLGLAVAVSLIRFRRGRNVPAASKSVAGTAYLFGSGIYCGTFMLGTNFIYRLMFLILCLPQLIDWQSEAKERGQGAMTRGALLAVVLSVLWLNGDANGHSTFLLIPQLIDWLLFFAFATILVSNLLSSSLASWKLSSH